MICMDIFSNFIFNPDLSLSGGSGHAMHEVYSGLVNITSLFVILTGHTDAFILWFFRFRTISQ